MALYELTPFNLALDGTVEQFYELYQDIYNSYLISAKTAKLDLSTYKNCDRIVALEKMDKIENLAFRRLRIFTDEFRNIHMEYSDFKHYSFFDYEKIKEFKWHMDFYNSATWQSPTRAQYCGENNGEFFLQKTAISFEQFLTLFQNLVSRAIYRMKKIDHSDCDFFTVRKEILNHITARMKMRREAVHPQTSKKLVPNNETLYLFDSLHNTKCKRDGHKIETKPYNCLAEKDSAVIVLPTHYCSQCKRYMMGRLSYSLFVKHFGVIKNKVNGADLGIEWDQFSESKLHALGYTVESGKLTEIERHNLLTRLIESKQITFFEVVSTIESDLNRFANHPKFVFAIPKWKADLRYINEWELKRAKKTRTSNSTQ